MVGGAVFAHFHDTFPGTRMRPGKLLRWKLRACEEWESLPHHCAIPPATWRVRNALLSESDVLRDLPSTNQCASDTHGPACPELRSDEGQRDAVAQTDEDDACRAHHTARHRLAPPSKALVRYQRVSAGHNRARYKRGLSTGLVTHQ